MLKSNSPIKNVEDFKFWDKNYFKTELQFKILFLGDYGVGKSSIIQRYTTGHFSANYKITIGADFAVKKINWDKNTEITLQLWDIAGHERFGFLTGVYYRYASAAVIVFDLTRPETFKSVDKWLKDLRRKVNHNQNLHFPVILLANKGDITTATIPPEIVDYCLKNGIITFYISSAKCNIRIDEAMIRLIQEIITNQNKSPFQYTNEKADQNIINLKTVDENYKSAIHKKRGCC